MVFLLLLVIRGEGGGSEPSAPGDSKKPLSHHQQQLILILHSRSCQSESCDAPHCGSMKALLQHMSSCSEHKDCQGELYSCTVIYRF